MRLRQGGASSCLNQSLILRKYIFTPKINKELNIGALISLKNRKMVIFLRKHLLQYKFDRGDLESTKVYSKRAFQRFIVMKI